MSINRIINMVINIIMRKVINALINGGIRLASRNKKQPTASPEGTAEFASQSGKDGVSRADVAKRAKIAARTIRRL